jgi:hypothetical protein
LLYNECEGKKEGEKTMKKLIIIVSALALVVSCATIDPNVAGKRVVIPGDEYYEAPYTSYGPSYYPSPYISVGIGWWMNPFFYWGFSYSPWYYSPYYYSMPYFGYYPWYPGFWGGYYPGYWGGGYYPGYGGGYYPGYGYPSYRYGKTTVTKRQLKSGSTSATGSRRTINRGSSGRSTSGGTTKSTGRTRVTKSGSKGRSSPARGSSGGSSRGSSGGSSKGASSGTKVKNK